MQGIHPYSPGIVRVGGEWEVHVCVQGGGVHEGVPTSLSNVPIVY